MQSVYIDFNIYAFKYTAIMAIFDFISYSFYLHYDNMCHAVKLLKP